MVFSGSASVLTRGHLAVVSHMVSPREIMVDQANWLNRGEIDSATPVLDVSENNDWSQGAGAGMFPVGPVSAPASIPISGFIPKG